MDAALEFVDLSTLEDRLEKSNVTTMEYRAKSGAWGRARFIASKRDEVGRLANVLYVSEDISVEKAEREKLRDMTERAIAANEAKTSFLSNMSHEIRTPINAILGMNEMILRESDDENILAYSESIRTAGGTLLGIVNDILDFSKIEAGKMEIIPVNYDLSSVINDLVNMVKARADEKGLEIILDIGKDVPKMLKGDEIRLKQIIMNILTNAVKYTEKGSVTFSVGFERIEKGGVAKARFDGAETDAVPGRFERGEGGGKIRESVSVGTVEREVAAGEDDLAEAGGEERPRLREHVIERN